MKPRNTLIRVKRFQVDEKRRQVAQIESMIADFHRMAEDLDRQILEEQKRSGIDDPTHFAYPTFAKAAMTRKENMLASADGLQGQLDAAQAALEEAFQDLKKVELLEERDAERERQDENRREQAALDEISLRNRARAV